MDRKCLLILLLILALSLVSGAGSASSLNMFANQQGVIKIAGGTAHITVMKEAAKRIMISNPKIVITIAGGGSGLGIKQAGEGLVNIGNSGRRATVEEQKRFNLKMFKWAIDGVGVVVNPDNPVNS
ncbi:MAG: phosphate ABC transporter substrate-binding protein, partial [Desulfobacula sp.]|nr:phosphate ABC transporter substrate-binding protein [Desulfobacula sp.]